MNDLERREIQEAISAADEALFHLEAAKRQLNSASGWGLLDLFGGGFIIGLIKHAKMEHAEREIEEAKYALQQFSKELQDVHGYSSIHIGELLSFADFFFDGFVADLLVQSKISGAKRQCDEAIYKVREIRRELAERLNS